MSNLELEHSAGLPERIPSSPYLTPVIRAARLTDAMSAIDEIELDMCKPDFSAKVREIFYGMSRRNVHPSYSKINTAAAVRLAESPIAGVLTEVKPETIDKDVFTVFLATKVFCADPEVDPKKVAHAIEVFQFSYHLLSPPLDYLAVGSLKTMIDGAQQLSPEERREVWSNMLGSMNLREQNLTMKHVGLFEFEQKYRPDETMDEMARRTGNDKSTLHHYSQILGVRNKLEQSQIKNDSTDNQYRTGDDRYGALARKLGILPPESYKAFVISIANEYKNRGLDVEDLTQSGMIEILKSMDRFDPSRETEFLTFALANVRGAIRREFRDRLGPVKILRKIKDRLTSLQTLEKTFTQLNGRVPSDEELSELMGMTKQELDKTRQDGNMRFTTSIERKINDEYMVRDEIASQTDDIDMSEKNMEVIEMLNTLPERERKILYLRFFEDRNQREIADEVGVSQVHVSRLIRNSLTMLRNAFQNTDFSD